MKPSLINYNTLSDLLRGSIRPIALIYERIKPTLINDMNNGNLLRGSIRPRRYSPIGHGILTGLLLLVISMSANAQYYYKDLQVPRQTVDQLRKFKENRIRTVKVFSYESDGQKTEDFLGTQTTTDNYTKTITVFKTPLAGESELTTIFNDRGQLLKTIDTTDGSGSVSEYFYNDKGLLSRIVNVSTSGGQQKEKEEHSWIYDVQGHPEKMLRIKNDVDTTYINFVLDENGNIAEENGKRNGIALPSFYYYHDNANRLTDIVSYSQKARRLLPVYIFEYNEGGLVRSMMVVPEGSDDYQKWYYEYNNRKLKVKETCFNKRKQILGRVEYEYE